MSTRLVSLAFGLFIATAFNLTAFAEKPEGGEVFQRYLQALGGEDALTQVESLTARGQYAIEGGPSGTITLHFARPNRLVFQLDFEGLGQVAQGYDGETAWSLHPVQGAKILDGEEAHMIKKWIARGFSLLPDPTAIEVGEAGVAEHDGVQCIKVSLSLPSTGESWADCYSEESGLLVGRWETASTPSGEAEMLAWAANYEPVGGVQFATHWRHTLGAREWSARYETIELNKVDPATFALPATIQTLLAENSHGESPGQ